MIGLGVVLNAVKALLDVWDIEVLEDYGLRSRSIHEHILVDTISRPRNDVRCRLTRRAGAEDDTSCGSGSPSDASFSSP